MESPRMCLSSEAGEVSCRDDPGFDQLLEHSQQTQARSCLTHTQRQCVCAAAAWFAVFLGCGADFGFTSQPRLGDVQTYIQHLENAERSWNEWIPTISMIPGCILSAFFMSVFGRRKLLIFITIPLTLRWLLVAFFQKQSIQIAATIIGALCSGSLWTLAPIYVGEISAPKQRGLFLAFLPLMSSMGSLFAQSAQMFISRIYLAKMFACSSICVALLSYFSLESPYWLILKGRRLDGIKVFGLLRGYQISAIKELKCLLDTETEHFAKAKYLISFFAIFKCHVLKSTSVVILFHTFAAFCGLHYFKDMNSDLFILDEESPNMLVAGEYIKSLLLVLSCVLFNNYSRRSICIWSCICIFLTSLMNTLYFAVSPEPRSLLIWIPFTCDIGFSCAITIGLLALSWVLSGELLPLEARGFSAGLSNCFSVAALFASTKVAALFISLSPICNLMHGLTGLILALVMNSALVETKNKTLIDIQTEYKRSL